MIYLLKARPEINMRRCEKKVFERIKEYSFKFNEENSNCLYPELDIKDTSSMQMVDDQILQGRAQ